MYQVTAIDTSQITSVNLSAGSSALPEVTVGGVMSKTRNSTASESSTQPLDTANAVLTPQADDTWPTISTMMEELQQSGILSAEQSTPDPNIPIATEVTPTLEPAPVISLANTAVTFQRPTADYILDQVQPHSPFPFSALISGLGFVIMVGIIGFMYWYLQQRGMNNQQILETTLDAVKVSR